jgi:hypothetical protein
MNCGNMLGLFEEAVNSALVGSPPSQQYPKPAESNCRFFLGRHGDLGRMTSERDFVRD